MNKSVSKEDNVVAVVTTFKPSETLIPRIKDLLKQVNKVILVDDSGKAELKSLCGICDIESLQVISNKDNIGIAATLNIGVAEAIKFSPEFILTLDDDTVISEDYVLKLCAAYKKSGKEFAPVGGVGGVFQNGELTTEEQGFFNSKRNLITSGMLIPIDVFKQVGFFDERLFIDLVDFEFCTKLRLAGYSLLEVREAVMEHTIGESEFYDVKIFKVLVYNHAPFRLYYQVRNVFIYSYKHWSNDPFFSVYLYLGIFKKILKVLFFESMKRERLSMIAKGLSDGFFNRGGRIN